MLLTKLDQKCLIKYHNTFKKMFKGFGINNETCIKMSIEYLVCLKTMKILKSCNHGSKWKCFSCCLDYKFSKNICFSYFPKKSGQVNYIMILTIRLILFYLAMLLMLVSSQHFPNVKMLYLTKYFTLASFYF